MNPQQTEQIESEISDLHVYLRASEDWEAGYREDASTFAMLLRAEARLQRHLREYQRGLQKRAHRFIRWDIYQRLKADVAPEVIVSLVDPQWDSEGKYLLNSVLDDMILIETLGATAAAVEYRRALDVADTTTSVIQSARQHSLEMITQQLNPTTRKLMKQSLANSIKLGESQAAAVARLRATVSNIQRAELIAQTETVNAFGRGNYNYANAAGAISKEWLVSLAPCHNICGPIPLQNPVDIDRPFITGNGKAIMYQGAHPRCRCRVIYNFPE